MSEKSNREKEIFNEALEIGSMDDRNAFVTEACGEDHQLREKVERLINAFEAAEKGFIPERNTETEDIATAVEMSEGPGTIIANYKLLEKIGEGGFGVVYMAEQEEPIRRRVALKIIKLGMDSKQVVARFEAERQALAMMDHPNIANIFGGGSTESGRPYFSMELVRGSPITQYCDEHQLGTEERLGLFIQVCHAVHHAHQKAIIHRDLKPSNVIVMMHDEKPMPKVIDFGIAKATQAKLTEKTLFTQWQQFIGTPAYMSPEQAGSSGLDVDTRSDVYSLGVLLYELLAGRTPFDSTKLLEAGYDEIRRFIREEDPPKPSTRLSSLNDGDRTTIATKRKTLAEKLGKRIRGELDWIVMKALEKDRTRRYDSSLSFAEDIQRHLDHEPVRARPPSVPYYCMKWARRNRSTCATAGVIAAAVIAVAVVSVFSALRLKHNLARQYLLKGQSLCEQGKMAAGLHWLVRSREETPPGNQALKRVIEDNLAAWNPQWVEPEAVLFHDSVVWCGAFSPDNRHVVIGSWTGGLTLWSISSGNSLWENKEAHDRWIETVAFSPDGTLLLTGSADHTAQLWWAASGEAVGRPMDYVGGALAAFSPDGRFVLVLGGENTVQTYSIKTGEQLSATLRHEKTIKSLAFSPDSRLALTGSDDGTARFWSLETGEADGPVLQHGQDVCALAFSPDGRTVATGCDEGTVRLWSVTTGEQLLPTLRHDGRIRTIAFHPDGSNILTASNDHTARLWSTATGDPIGHPMHHDSDVWTANFGPDGSRILTASLDTTARLWSAETAEPLGLPLRHRAWAHEALFSPNGDRILTLSAGLVAQIWDAANVHTPVLTLESGPGTGMAIPSPNGDLIATGNWWSDGDVRFWDATTGEHRASDVVHPGGVWKLSFSPDSRCLLTAGKDGLARLWDVRSRQPLDFTLKHQNEVRAGVYSGDGRLIATGSVDGTARIWSAANGSPLSPPLEHPDHVQDVVFNPDGKILLTACADGVVRLWSVATAQEILPRLYHGASLQCVDISTNGLIATGGQDNAVRFWNLKDGRPSHIVLPHDGFVGDVTFSPDGGTVLTGSFDSKFRLWSVETGERIGPILSSNAEAYPYACVFSPDGKRVILTSLYRGQAKILDLPILKDRDHANPRLRVEVLTHLEMDDRGILTWIAPEAWRAKQEQLAALEGESIR